MTLTGIEVPLGRIRTALGTTTEGTNIAPIVKLLRGKGLRVGYRTSMRWREMTRTLQRGAIAIAHLDGDHFGVVHGADEKKGIVLLADPSLLRQFGRRITRTKFLRERWTRWALVVSQRSEPVRQRVVSK